MSSPSLKRIEELFHRAAGLNPEQRAAFLEVECAGDPKLKAEVEALLRHDQPSGDVTDFLESPFQRWEDGATLRPHAGEALIAPGIETPAIPGYEILEELGRGGMGVVYKARQLGLNRLVALKMLLSIGPVRPEDFARFRLEAESLAQLHHPNIVQIYEVGEHEGLPYFAMEYIDGPSLDQQTGGVAQAPATAARLVEILARAMAVVHQRGIIHRDLKPANVLLQKSEVDGSRSTSGGASPPTSSTDSYPVISDHCPKITDFGLAKRWEASGSVTRTGTVIGTPWYMPPEQAQGDISGLGPWTDLYSLGAILYELLTGRPPIQEESPAAAFVKLISEEFLPPSRWRPGLPRDLDTICLKCLEKDPHRRYASAAELAEDLRRYQAGEPIKARPISVVERTWRWCCRQPLAATALASTGVLGLALLITVVVYNARLRETIAREAAEAGALAEARRVQLVHLHINLAVRELDNGDAFTSLLWLMEAMKLDEANADHRRRILQVLEHIPWLIQFGKCDGDVLACRFTTNDCWLALVRPDLSVQIWDVLSGKPIGPRLEHAANFFFSREFSPALAAFSPDGRWLATGSSKGAARVWRLDSGESHLLSVPDSTPKSPGSETKRLVFDSSGRFLLTQSANGAVQCWEVAKGKAVSLPRPMDNPGTILSPDGRFVLSVDSSRIEKLWNVADDRTTSVQLEIGPGALPSAVSTDGSLAAFIDQNSVRIVETATGNVRGKPLRHLRPVQRVVFTSGGDYLLTVDADHVARLWQWTKTGAEDLPTLTVPSGSRKEEDQFAQFDLNGRFLAALGSDDRLRIWDVKSHKLATPPLHPRVALQYETFSTDGKRLLLVGKNHTVRLWDLSPCASGGQAPPEHAIQPGMSRDFTFPHLAALAQELAGARIDEQEQLVPLDEEDLFATWQRFQNFQASSKKE
jgi:serine/threonine protein kinase/WD40 repeat protein